jgi:4-amino-4-deoxy-L-arabinose transferase-like glycosyltransferase
MLRVQQIFKNKFSVVVGLLVLSGFWIRVSFSLGKIYHIDEFISMLAATMVAERGLPILPSGLFYDHGLLFSFFSGGLVALLDFREEVARWPTVLISVVTIAAYFTVARRLFDSRITGLLAAALVTLDGLSIVWGVRARMYTQAHLFVLLSAALLIEGTLKRPQPRARYLAVLFLAAALLSHTVTFLIVAPLAVLILISTLFRSSNWLPQPRIWLEAIVALTVVVGALLIVALGQTGSTVSLQNPNAAAAAPLGLGFLRGFFLPGLGWDRFDDLLDFFRVPEYIWLLPIIVLSLLVTLYRLARRQTTVADIVFLFLILFSVLVIFEQGALLTSTWQKSRYLFIIVQPAFLLLSAESLARLLRWIVIIVSNWIQSAAQIAWMKALPALGGVAIIVSMWGGEAWHTAHAQGTGNYDTAFTFVHENWQPGDKIMTIHPSAAYLYAGQSDYYANQVSAKVIADEEAGHDMVDRYAGSPLIDSVEKLNDVLASGSRIWFVVDKSRLYSRYDSFFTQQIFAQMDHVYQTGGVYVFLSRLYPVPVPAEPTVARDANFSDLIHLQGYSFEPATIAPDGTIPLALYWGPIIGPPPPFGAPKVFVQLRNNKGEIIAQADHFIYEGLLTLEELQILRNQDEWLRDTADLQIPIPLPPDGEPYQIYVGLYNPVTFERVPVLNDTSGENSVVVNLPAFPF